jgi:hypothetical protein
MGDFNHGRLNHGRLNHGRLNHGRLNHGRLNHGRFKQRRSVVGGRPVMRVKMTGECLMERKKLFYILWQTLSAGLE